MSTSAPKRTIFCPTGCHEDYLERESFEAGNNTNIFYGTTYSCLRCGWVAQWDNADGFRVRNAPEEQPDLSSDDEQRW